MVFGFEPLRLCKLKKEAANVRIDRNVSIIKDY